MSNTESNRKIILDLAVTLDGFIEGPNGEIDWCIMDSDMGFIDIKQRLGLKLINTKKFSSGVVQLCYHPEGN